MEIIKFMNGNNANKKLNDNTFVVLDELILISESKYLFRMISILKLLLLNDSICNRYNCDFTIINQILYKINIPFEELNERYEEKEEKNNMEMDNEIEMNLMDIKTNYI